MLLIALLVENLYTVAQKTPGGPTQPGLPEGCVGSFPDIDLCHLKHFDLGNTVDQCAPPGPYPVSGQQVYIQDEVNFCINLPNPNSVQLQNVYYSKGLFPSIVQAEGYVQSFCMGSYLPPGSLPLPVGGIRSAHVIKDFTKSGQHYYQIAGTLDCDLLRINCTQSAPDAFDDGGQYDNAPFKSCGKEPYSGVDDSDNGHPGWKDYVEMAGDYQFCMRVCEPGNQVAGGVCDVTQDTKGCIGFMKIDSWPEGFSFTDRSTGKVQTTSVFLPEPSTTASSTKSKSLTLTAESTLAMSSVSNPNLGQKISGVANTRYGKLIGLISIIFAIIL